MGAGLRQSCTSMMAAWAVAFLGSWCFCSLQGRFSVAAENVGSLVPARANVPADPKVRVSGKPAPLPLAAAPVGAPSGDGGHKRALLVGCTRYPNLSQNDQLAGPGNDVVLFRDLLVERFGFSASDIVVLAEEHAQELPTRQNIVRQFVRLAEGCSQDDWVVILLAGHGSQQPVPANNDPQKNFEPDGLDEVFCPRDVEGLAANQSGRITNAIVDDEIGQWLQRISERGARVWIILDACHSGTAIRGNDTERPRRLLPESLVPHALLEAARRRAAAARAQSPLAESDALGKGHLVAMYACQPHEFTVEKPLPPGSDQYHGLFTYALVQVLSQCQAPLTYQQLVERIHGLYVAWNRVFPTPLVEGPDADRFVLGADRPAATVPLRLRRQPGGELWLNGGAIHGLSPNSIVAVYPPPGQAQGDKPLGYARITKAGALTSALVPCAFQGLDARPDLPQGARCEVVMSDWGLDRLRVAVDDRDAAGRPVPPAQRAGYEQSLRRACQRPGLMFEMVDRPAEAEWLVRLDGGRVLLVPGSGWPQGGGVGGPPAFQPDRAVGEPAEALQRALETIARARNLLRLAASGHPSGPDQAGKGLDVDAELLVEAGPGQNPQPLAWQPQGRTVRPKTRAAIRILNREPSDADVTLLWVDSHFGITPIFPAPGELNRLPGHSSKTIGPGEIGDRTLGLEHLVLLAVRAQPLENPYDFSFLEQPGLEVAADGPATRAAWPRRANLRPGLEELLAQAWLGGGTRGPRVRQAGQPYTIRLLSVQVLP